jgi:retrograde regulation protein 2
MMFVHSSLPKESASLAALYTPITGQLASAHGISHADRALLALMLCYRWGSDLAPPHDLLQSRLRAIVTPQEVWWCHYIGTIAKLIGDVYPAGVIPNKQQRLQFEATWAEGLGKKGLAQGVVLMIHAKHQEPMTASDVLRDAIVKIESVGKKKNRIGGRDGFGVPVDVHVERDLP